MIYSNKKYLLEFDSNLIDSIKKLYGENSITFDRTKQEMTIITNLDNVTVKYTAPPPSNK